MLWLRASIEPRRLWPCGGIGLAEAGMVGCVVGCSASIERYHGLGRWRG